ncbi:MAG: HEAT repeat domain-containing protein [Planctomycetes bacterium]|nr:HEAT repeat domain-containing protein [Planctomycetota bacterium]
MIAAPTVTITRCHRCGSKLAYEGRPCQVCISPAVFEFKNGKIGEINGFERATHARLPKFAQPITVRGKNIRKPRGARAIEVARTLGRWTWNSIGIAATIHLLALVIAMFFGQKIREVVDYVQKVEVQQEVAAAPVVAPEPDEVQLPDLQPIDDELVMPDQIVNDPDILAGDPEYEAPPEPTPYAPLPQVASPHPAPPSQNPFRRPEAGQGLGGGQPSASNHPAAGSGLFRNRNGESKKAAIQEHGGGTDTENSVNLGLEYLAKKQEYNGSWDPNEGFKRRPSWATSDNGYRGAVTALCTLPFLAAGNAPDSGPFQKNVRRAVDWLLSQQTSDGCVAYKNQSQMYTHTVATLVLCETYGMCGDEEIGNAAERAVRFLERSQGVGGGWDYKGYVTSTGGELERNDLSISGWAALAFKSARAVGIKVNQTNWNSLAGLYDRYSLESGETYYADRDSGSIAGTRKGIGMVGVGLTARVVLDAERFETRNFAAERMLLENTPDWERFSDPSPDSSNPNYTTFYGWYYGTLGMFLLNDGRGPAWDKWNKALKKQLLDNQQLRGNRKGSWEAADSWIGPIMGDFYSTALSVLCLEVYYRYNTIHRPDSETTVVRPRRQPREVPEVKEPEPEHPANGIVINGEELDLDKAGHRSKYLRLLARDKGMGALPVLLKHLEDESASVRSTALMEIGRLKAKDAAPKVEAMLKDPDDQQIKLTVIDTLGSLGDRSVYPSLVRLLSSGDDITQDAAQSALRKLSGGKDFGVNKRAWEDWFSRNP